MPKQISTGDRTILGGISRRGNRYLRTLFIQGARSVLQRSDGWENKSFGRRLIAASKRLHKNVLAVALANKLARIAWTVLYHVRGYDTAFAKSGITVVAAKQPSRRQLRPRRGSREETKTMEQRSSLRS